MNFSRISVTKKGVELDFDRQDDDATEEVKWSSHHNPLPEFRDAMQGFVAYIVALIPFLDAVKDSLTVTTLNLSTDKNDHVGLIVTATTPVEKAYKKPLVLNTPLVREGGENASDDAFVLSDEVLDLIDLVESEARRYKNGEHEQGELFTKEDRTAQPTNGTSENVREFDQAAAHAEVSSTRKPKGRKGKGGKTPPQSATGVAVIANEPGEPLTDVDLQNLLAKAGRNMPIDALAILASSERDSARAWAEAVTDPFTSAVDVPPEPECVKAFSTSPLPLVAEEIGAADVERVD